MNAKDFIISNLTEISNEIPDIQLRYAFDETLKFHIIEISPESIRRGNEKYMEMEYNLWNNFQQMFPDEDLVIGETDDINNMSNILYETGPLIQSRINDTDALRFDSIFSTWIKNLSAEKNSYALAA